MPWLFSFRKSKKPLVYLGPSLSLARARQILDAEFRPPIRRGDLPKDLAAGYRVFGIIDGVFHQSLSVSIREIRRAIEGGAQLYGSSSMGALRAAETYPLGMVGIGEIYHWYRTEVVDSDDEVALIFEEATGRPLSLPLVNIRATLGRALSSGKLSQELHEKILECAISLPFPSRSLEYILQRGFLEAERAKIKTLFLQEAVDLKAEDAEALLTRIRDAHV